MTTDHTVDRPTSAWTRYRLRRRISAGLRRSPPPVPVAVLRPRFDAEWYVATYGLAATATSADPFDHYVAVGARLGFSPGPTFDERRYLNDNPDVADAVRRGDVRSGHEHFVLHGEREGRSPSAVGARGADGDEMGDVFATTVRSEFDPDWYADRYHTVAESIGRGDAASPLWHYVTEGAARGLSPNSWFDESWYMRSTPDVAYAKAAGAVPCGFFHYLRHGESEGRAPNETERSALELTYVGITRPVGVERLPELDRKLRPFPYTVVQGDGAPRINVLFPTLDKGLLFGGYIAALNLVRRLQERGWAVRLLITDDARCNADRIRKQFGGDPLEAVLADADIVNLARRAQVLDLHTGDRFLAYSMWAGYHADLLAKAVGRRFVFLIQEHEPAFHQHDCWHALGSSIYRKPHFAMFNSELLRRYFADHRIGVYADGDDMGRASSVVFEHALATDRTPSEDDLVRGRGPRRLLFYARPEAHAARNLFEIGVAGIRRAVAEGVFEDDEWEFVGIGSLGDGTSVKLGRGHTLALQPRLGLGDYTAALCGYEVGLSLQYVPHPGVVHFEMAASGVMTVTNTFDNRDERVLVAISPNLVPVDPTPEGVAAGLAEAVRRAKDVAACVEGADRPWVRSWGDAFNEDVMARLEAELA